MYLQIQFEVHHNEERSYSPEVFMIDNFPPTGEQLCNIVRSLLKNSDFHCDWVYDATRHEFDINTWILENEQVLRDWLFSTKNVDATFLCPFDEEGEYLDLIIFNNDNRGHRNIGFNTTDGDKGDGLWINSTVIDDDITKIVDSLADLSREELAEKFALSQFGYVHPN